MIRITQDKKSTKFPVKEIDQLCSSGEKEEIEIFDIISPVESENSELEIPSIEDEDSEIISYKKLSDESDYNNDEKVKNAFDLFYDEDEEEDDEESEASIPSEEIQGGEGTPKKREPEDEGDKEEEEEEEEEEEQEEEPEAEQEETENIINIDNLSLKKKNPYFETRIERLDPVLIIKEDSK